MKTLATVYRKVKEEGVVLRKGVGERPVTPRPGFPGPVAPPGMARQGAVKPTQISLRVAGHDVQGDLEAEARIATDPEGLSKALAENPARFAWWATLEALAKAEAEEAGNARDALHAELFSHYEAALSRTDTEGKRAKATVGAIEAAILNAERYQAALTRVVAANKSAALLGVARRAMDHRKESLLAVASNYRAELDARIRDQVREVRERMAMGRATR